ncbi:unnamed protein product [Oikopleura dioica]|uniref:Ribosomal protein L30 ferredoxin-like fold domain-containing protein n=1 Tax=Oikopleura dioica TaxID=34765 RepID=E4XWH1_OIKDI|nr:unnamed protein product [Oikopleura dioica]
MSEEQEKKLTVDNGPEVLDRVPEHYLKKRKRYNAVQRKENERIRTTRTKRAAPTIEFKRAEHFLRASKLGKRDETRVRRQMMKLVRNIDTKNTGFKKDVKLVLVVRIRTADGIGKMAIRAMRELRVMEKYHAAFVRYTEKTHRLLRVAEPYITWGVPDVTTIRDLLTKRGFANVNGERMILNSNAAVENALGHIDMLAIEDLIKEVVSVGENFDTVNKFLAPFVLSAPPGGTKKNHIATAKGGQNGDRGEDICAFVRSMA